jgi:hypothetical protein
MYVIKIRETTESNLKEIARAKDLKEVFEILENYNNLEEVHLKYYERITELEKEKPIDKGKEEICELMKKFDIKGCGKIINIPINEEDTEEFECGVFQDTYIHYCESCQKSFSEKLKDMKIGDLNL